MSRPARILVADDDVDLLETLVSALSGRGFEVTGATNGVELLEHLADDDPYDLIITDVSMPWSTGLQVMASTRYSGMLDVPVIVITALRTPTLPEQVRRLGGRARLLHKPFDLDALHAAVDEALAGEVGLSPAH